MVFEKIQILLSDKLDCDKSEITEETLFSDLGIDSLDVAELVMSLEDELGFEIEIEPGLKSVSDLAACIEAKIVK